MQTAVLTSVGSDVCDARSVRQPDYKSNIDRKKTLQKRGSRITSYTQNISEEINMDFAVH